MAQREFTLECDVRAITRLTREIQRLHARVPARRRPRMLRLAKIAFADPTSVIRAEQRRDGVFVFTPAPMLKLYVQALRELLRDS